MRTLHRAALSCAAVLLALVSARRAGAHGFAGERFFPPTITTDDPFAADELALPTVSVFKNPGKPEVREIDAGFELDKLILPDLSLGVSDTHVNFKPGHGRGASGWDNVGLSLKYNLWTDAKHEAIVSVGAKAEVGGTGAKRVGADSSTTFSPAVFFGKGFGDLPDSLAYFKPLAVTGVLSQSFPTHASPNVLEWGVAVQYNLPYLQAHVKDVGLPAPFKDLIPLVEFSFHSPENRHGGQTTGTVNPGVLYESKYFQAGVEALVPINRESGRHVGAIFQIWIFLDDIDPKHFGKPLFGR